MILHILQRHLPQAQVWAFGSRVKGTARQTSDLDLCIDNHAPLPLETLAHLKDAFAESNVPYRVDVLDWYAAGAEFQNLIAKERVPLVNAGHLTVS